MDISRLKPIVGNPNWFLMEEFLQEERNGYIKRLISEDDQLLSMELRGRIRELDTLLRLPSKIKT